MDAGPVLRQVQVPVDLHDTAPDLLDRLFLLGTDVLLECLPSVWDGSAPGLAVAQDASRATHAAKVIAEVFLRGVGMFACVSSVHFVPVFLDVVYIHIVDQGTRDVGFYTAGTCVSQQGAQAGGASVCVTENARQYHVVNTHVT